MNMSVLIRGMEMPKCCFVCACYHNRADDGYYDYEICGASGTVFNDGYASVTGHKDHIDPFKARLDNCPLVPVPPHGRLGDLDALLFNIPAPIEDEYKYVRRIIEETPTIIPAEEVKA